MSRLTLLLSVTSFLYVHDLAGQCNVKREQDKDGILFHNAKERIFQNDDLEFGIQTVFISMACFISTAEHETDNSDKVLGWWLLVKSGASQGKQWVIPREITLRFSDGTNIKINAKYLNDPTMSYTVKLQEGMFVISEDILSKILTKQVNEITITDSRSRQSIQAKPYERLLMEQGACLKEFVANDR